MKRLDSVDSIESRTPSSDTRGLSRVAWLGAFVILAGQRVWNAIDGPLMRGWDDFGHVGYVLFLDLYGAVPWADQGWSYFHPPLHYVIGWGLAQFGSAEVLLRGLSLIGGAASLLIAWLAARVTREVHPDSGSLPWLVFVSVGSLPVYLYTGTMAGNEMTAAAFGTLGFAIFLTNEARSEPQLRWDVAAGLVFGLALLTKASALLTLGAAGLALLFRALQAAGGRDLARVRHAIRRGVVLAGVAGVIASPFYLRNVSEFGTPFRMSRGNPQVAALEERQLPGERSWVDLVYIPAALFSDPHPKAPHMLHSIWGTPYVQMWADPRGRSEFAFRAVKSALWDRARRIGAVMGLLPTLLALFGCGLAAADVLRGRRGSVYVPLFFLSGTTLGAFAWFAFDAPQFSALKASYLLGLTLPYAVFMARSLVAIGSALVRRAAMSLVVVIAAVGLVNDSSGLVLPKLPPGSSLPLVYVAFDEREAARRLLEISVAYPTRTTYTGTDNLADLEMIEGRPGNARRFYLSGGVAERNQPERWNALGAANALLGKTRWALVAFENAIEGGQIEVGLVNRGVVHAMDGDLDQAETDLRKALEIDPLLIPAWHNLAEVLDRADRPLESERAAANSRSLVGTPPRGFAYGIPHGLGHEPSRTLGIRWMLWLDGRDVQLARAPYRDADAISSRRDSRSSETLTPAHLVLIVVDTLRADHLGSYGYPRPTSPNIDRIAREGVRFANASAISSWTLPSVASLFTSLYPPEHGATAWGKKIRRSLPTLPGLLRNAGYRTIGVSGNFVHITQKGGFARGFGAFRSLGFSAAGDGDDPLLVLKRPGGGTVRTRAPSAAEVNETLFQLLPDTPDGPLFVYAHYMEPHSGYEPPPDQLARFVTNPQAHRDGPPATTAYVNGLAGGEVRADAAELQRLVDLYDGEIASVDAAIGELLAELERRGYGDELVVSVVADHGEEFLDHGGWFHGLNLFGESLAVPWVISDSRPSSRGIVRHERVDLIDVTPTLLSMVGVEPAPGMRGRAMLSDAPGPRDMIAWLDPDERFEASVAPRVARRAFTRWPWKLIVDRDGGVAVYRLDRDPSEQRPMTMAAAELPPGLRKLAGRLARDATATPSRARPAEPIDPKQRARLRALGYED
ncbi:MAG: sulfatase-like hydrolase/transferase [Myxococcota bacterium]